MIFEFAVSASISDLTSFGQRIMMWSLCECSGSRPQRAVNETEHRTAVWQLVGQQNLASLGRSAGQNTRWMVVRGRFQHVRVKGLSPLSWSACWMLEICGAASGATGGYTVGYVSVHVT